MALALVLLVGSGLMIRSFQTLRRVNPGFSAPEEILAARLSIPGAQIPDGVDAAAAHEQIADVGGDGGKGAALHVGMSLSA